MGAGLGLPGMCLSCRQESSCVGGLGKELVCSRSNGNMNDGQGYNSAMGKRW